MTDSALLSAVSSLRWQLPVRTPSDEAQQDQMACGVIEALLTLAAAPIQTQRFSPLSLSEPIDLADDIFRQSGPDLQFDEAEGRAAVGAAVAKP